MFVPLYWPNSDTPLIKEAIETNLAKVDTLPLVTVRELAKLMARTGYPENQWLPMIEKPKIIETRLICVSSLETKAMESICSSKRLRLIS